MGDIILAIIVSFLLSRALSRLMGGIREGLSGQPRQPTSPQPGVHMERDPVCGTFVVPSGAITIMDGRRRFYFCSAACRDLYRARPSTHSGHPERVEGRTA